MLLAVVLQRVLLQVGRVPLVRQSHRGARYGEVRGARSRLLGGAARVDDDGRLRDDLRCGGHIHHAQRAAPPPDRDNESSTSHPHTRIADEGETSGPIPLRSIVHLSTFAAVALAATIFRDTGCEDLLVCTGGQYEPTAPAPVSVEELQPEAGPAVSRPGPTAAASAYQAWGHAASRRPSRVAHHRRKRRSLGDCARRALPRDS